jgi:hypothetical protein
MSAAAVVGICMNLALAPANHGGGASVFIPTERFTLAWTHSIEKQRWEEDYAVLTLPARGAQGSGAGADSAAAGASSGAQAPARGGAADSGSLRLLPLAARIRGSGAGMEPPEGAQLRAGWYHYRPATPPLAELLLARSRFAADYDWCEDGAVPRCRPLAALLPLPPDAPDDGATTRLWPCRRPAPR